MVEAHGVTFIGPSPTHIRTMGDKIAAKTAMAALGVPLVAGSARARWRTLEEARGGGGAQMGYPVLVKAAAGGGGRGMKVAQDRQPRCDEAWSVARAEAKAAFGNDEVYLEKYLDRPRHIELQVHGRRAMATWCISASATAPCSAATRSCWRRRAPPPCQPRAARRDRRHRHRRRWRQLGYRNAGTLEFLYQDGQFAFIEMNTRLQVEHPVTEMVCGVDLVREQIRIAAGESRWAIAQADVRFHRPRHRGAG